MAINPLWDVDYLKKNHYMIHYFGLGFIQLKLTQLRRMHFYTPELPAIVGTEDIHNHRYDFKSYILKGCLEQELFQLVPGTQFVREKESCNAEIKSDDTVEFCDVIKISEQKFVRESNYWIHHNTFHRVKATVPTITVLDRGYYRKQFADVVRYRGEKKVCPFSQKVAEDRLWEIVRGMLNG